MERTEGKNSLSGGIWLFSISTMLNRLWIGTMQVEHLGKAVEYLYGMAETLTKQHWINEYKEILFQGHAERIVHVLCELAEKTKSEGLHQEAGYFENHKRRMNYLELRAESWFIGNGTVESVAKQYKAHFTGPCMRCKQPYLEHLIPVRSAVMSGNFNHRFGILFITHPQTETHPGNEKNLHLRLRYSIMIEVLH